MLTFDEISALLQSESDPKLINSTLEKIMKSDHLRKMISGTLTQYVVSSGKTEDFDEFLYNLQLALSLAYMVGRREAIDELTLEKLEKL